MQVTSGVHSVGAVIVALGIVTTAAAIFGVRKSGGPALPAAVALGAAWLLSAALALSGILARFDAKPPPMVLFMVACLALGVGLGLSSVGRHLSALPLWVLVLSQAFRLPLELAMHQAGADGVMPVELSFSGYNFDIVSGAGAVVVGLVLWRQALPPSALQVAAWLWNIVGVAALGTIVVIAVLSSPMIRFFGDDPAHLNTWVTHVPYVWLPAVLVVNAVAAHVVVTRALLRQRAAAQSAAVQ